MVLCGAWTSEDGANTRAVPDYAMRPVTRIFSVLHGRSQGDSIEAGKFDDMAPDTVSALDGVVSRMKSIFTEEGVPPALVWVAEVESAWDPHACSRAGAVGLFQFMPETARHLGLNIEDRDERVLPYKSARAAARYLLHLKGRFGSWRLALAAYNAGEGRVDQAIQAAGSQRFSEVAAFLPRETRRYVPKVFSTISRHESFADGDA